MSTDANRRLHSLTPDRAAAPTMSVMAIYRQLTCYASHMNPRQIVIFVAALLFLVGSVLPKPIIEKATGKPFENQWLARGCLAAVGVAMILALRTVPWIQKKAF